MAGWLRSHSQRALRQSHPLRCLVRSPSQPWFTSCDTVIPFSNHVDGRACARCHEGLCQLQPRSNRNFCNIVLGKGTVCTRPGCYLVGHMCAHCLSDCLMSGWSEAMVQAHEGKNGRSIVEHVYAHWPWTLQSLEPHASLLMLVTQEASVL
jgi:hypothetical protein